MLSNLRFLPQVKKKYFNTSSKSKKNHQSLILKDDCLVKVVGLIGLGKITMSLVLTVLCVGFRSRDSNQQPMDCESIRLIHTGRTRVFFFFKNPLKSDFCKTFIICNTLAGYIFANLMVFMNSDFRQYALTMMLKKVSCCNFKTTITIDSYCFSNSCHYDWSTL